MGNAKCVRNCGSVLSVKCWFVSRWWTKVEAEMEGESRVSGSGSEVGSRICQPARRAGRGRLGICLRPRSTHVMFGPAQGGQVSSMVTRGLHDMRTLCKMGIVN